MSISFLQAKNNAHGWLAVAIGTTDTTVQLEAGDGASFPSDYPYHVTIGNSEIVKVTNISTDTMTVERAKEGTTAISHSINESVRLNVTAEQLTEIQQALNGLFTTPGLRTIFGSDPAGVGIYGSGIYGVQGEAVTGNALVGFAYGVSVGVWTSSQYGSAADFGQWPTSATQNFSGPTVLIRRQGNDFYETPIDVTQPLLLITDAWDGLGANNAPLISGTCGLGTYLSINPRVADGASAVAHLLGTYTTLSNATSKLLSLKNGATEKMYVLYNGGIVSKGPITATTVTTFTANDATPDVSAGNIFKNNASDTTHDITMFDGGTAGQVITIIGNDADATVKDAGNLKLSADWVATVGNTLTLVFDGTNWYEISRSANA